MQGNARLPAVWTILVGSALLLSLAMGMRQSLGLFLLPMKADLGLSAADFTLSVAIQNMVWGLSQPFVGALADRIGFRRVAVSGAFLYAAGNVCAALAIGPLALTLGAGPLIGVALSCTAASLNMSAAARAVPEARRSATLGMISAAGSIGTFAVAPFAQTLIAGPGWRIAMIGFVALSLVMIPAALLMGRADRMPVRQAAGAPSGLAAVARRVFQERAFVVMTAAYFVCGLQLVFLTSHLPTYLSICGMDPMLSAESLAVIGAFNVVGSYLFGWLGGKYPKHVLLGLIYVLRSLALGAYFVLPPTTGSTLAFAAVMGLLWLGVVPLVSGIVASLFGLRYMATITGIAFMSHQLDSFLGAYGGGMIYDLLGSYDRAWQIGMMIGVVAGLAQIVAGNPDRPAARMALA